MAENWSGAKAKALKVLGKDGKIPDPKNFDKLKSDWWTAFAAYQQARDDMEAKILDLQKTGTGVQLSMKQFGEKLDSEDFGLDPKSKDDAKKIKEAQDILTGFVDGLLTAIDTDVKGLDELDKHV